MAHKIERPEPARNGTSGQFLKHSDANLNENRQPAQRSQIEVLEIRPNSNGGTVKAFVKVRIGGLTLHGLKVVQQSGQKAWCALPDQKSSDGKWFPVVEATKPLKDRITATVLDAWSAL